MQLKPNVLWLVPRPLELTRDLRVANQKLNIHYLVDELYDYNDVNMEFSPEALMARALEMIKQKNIKGVFAMNCYAVSICSIISKLAGLPGPSFKSVFYLNLKYYARTMLHQYEFKDFWYFPIYYNTILSEIRQKINGRYPCIFKICCSTHSRGQKYAYCDEDLDVIWSDLQHFIPGMIKKNYFYYKYLDEEDRPEESPDDMPVFIVEKMIDPTKNVEFFFQGIISSRKGEETQKLQWYSFGEVDLFKNGDSLSWTSPTRYNDSVVSNLCKRFQATQIKKLKQLGFNDSSFDLGFFINKQTGMIHILQNNSRLSFLAYNYNQFSGPGIDTIKHLAQISIKSKATGIPLQVRKKPCYLVIIRQYVPGKPRDLINVEKYLNPPKGFQTQNIKLDVNYDKPIFSGPLCAPHLSYVIYNAENYKEGLQKCLKYIKEVEITRPKELQEQGAFQFDQQLYIGNKSLTINDHW